MVTQISCTQEEKKRIKEDIIEMLVQKFSGNLDSNPVDLMGKLVRWLQNLEKISVLLG